MRERTSFAYVVGIDSSRVTLNLKDEHKGQIAAHRDGVSNVTEVGALFGVTSGALLLVMRVQALKFAEPEEAHRRGVGTPRMDAAPLRNLVAVVLGYLSRDGGVCSFEFDSLRSPALGAEAYPLSEQELNVATQPAKTPGATIDFGTILRTGESLRVNIGQALGRHVAVLGSTGQGKSGLTTAVLQQLVKLPKPRIIVFDINGEYKKAIEAHVPIGEGLKVSVLGGASPTFRIPYYAFGRHGLGRLFLPSEKTQRPALNFALDALRHVKWFPDEGGTGLVSDTSARFFDDCRPVGPDKALAGLGELRASKVGAATVWPHMLSLGCLVAESHSTRTGTKGPERNAFDYGNVAPLVTRIRRYSEDPLFQSVVNVDGGAPCSGTTQLDWLKEGETIVEEVFGGATTPWKIHVLDLRNVAHDLMPLVLGGLLELLAFEMFRRGPGATYPTMVVLEEAHHYMRPVGDRDDTQQSGLAYERLAKEGRKFGLGLWLSTQRPCEVSATVLSQCGTWVVFRLTGDQDIRAVATASEWVDSQELERISGLPRRQAIVFGASVALPTRVSTPEASPPPDSHDPAFNCWSTSKPPVFPADSPTNEEP